MRDKQKNGVYRAERTLVAYAAPCFSVAEAQQFTDAVVYSRWFKKRHPLLSASGIVVSSQHGRLKNNACGRYGKEMFPVVELPPSGRTPLRILHEIAHLCTEEHDHGRLFAAVYLLLVHRWSSQQDAKLLAGQFKVNHVKFRPKRILSEEAKQKLRDRMTAMRTKRNDDLQNKEV